MKVRYEVMSAGIIFLSACTHTNSHNGWENKYTIREVDELKLELDSTTSQETNYIQLVNDSILAFLNKPTSEICLYDITKSSLKGRIIIHREGPDAVNGVDAFFIEPYQEEPESIWLYASWGQRIYHINSEGSLLGSFEVPRTETLSTGNFSVSPYARTTTPYIVRGDIHYLQGMDGIPTPNLKPGATILYNISSGKVRTGTVYPEIYGPAEEIHDKWDTFAYCETFSQWLPNEEIITSFPASDSLYVWNPETDQMAAYLADYSKRPEIVPQMGKDRDENFENYIKSFQYGAILYDLENELYYRLFRDVGEVDNNDLRGSVTKKPMGVIILDKNFEKVGEAMLSEGEYYPADSFVVNGTLYVSILSDDDDFMKFKGFKVKEL